MAIKGYSAFPKAPAGTSPSIVLCHIQDTRWGGDLTPLQRRSQCILQPQPTERTIFWVFVMTRPRIEPRSPGPLANTLLVRPIFLRWSVVIIIIIIIIADYYAHFGRYTHNISATIFSGLLQVLFDVLSKLILNIIPNLSFNLNHRVNCAHYTVYHLEVMSSVLDSRSNERKNENKRLILPRHGRWNENSQPPWFKWLKEVPMMQWLSS